jgi:carbon-monoxide dehydrogenase large subunit
VVAHRLGHGHVPVGEPAAHGLDLRALGLANLLDERLDLREGIGQALFEDAVYDPSGNLLTGSLLDYPLPTAADLPSFQLAHTVTPTDVNPMGVKGIGEAGTIGSAHTIVNAVIDALSPLGVKHIDMPLRPKRVWAAIQEARS